MSVDWWMSSRWRVFAFMYVMEAFSFFIIVANNRATAQGSYFWTTITDTLFGLQGFALGKLMIDDPRARSWWSGIGGVLGGTSGSLLSIWVTKHLYGA